MSGARGDRVVNLAVNKGTLQVTLNFAASRGLDAMTLRPIALDHGPSTIFIKPEVATSEVDGMERYLDKVLKEAKSKSCPGVPEQGEN